MTDAHRKPVAIRRGYSIGLTFSELLACAAPARENMARIAEECVRGNYGIRAMSQPKGFGVLARAMRSKHPGRVFAHAAATGENDPLMDTDSRLFVGLAID